MVRPQYTLAWPCSQHGIHILVCMHAYALSLHLTECPNGHPYFVGEVSVIFHIGLDGSTELMTFSSTCSVVGQWCRLHAMCVALL